MSSNNDSKKTGTLTRNVLDCKLLLDSSNSAETIFLVYISYFRAKFNYKLKSCILRLNISVKQER